MIIVNGPKEQLWNVSVYRYESASDEESQRVPVKGRKRKGSGKGKVSPIKIKLTPNVQDTSVMDVDKEEDNETRLNEVSHLTLKDATGIYIFHFIPPPPHGG